MNIIRMCVALLGLTVLVAAPAQADGVVVIGHPQLPRLNATVLRKLYTGRSTEVNGAPVIVVNAPPGSPVRNRFLNTYVEQDEERYVAYWTVRRFIGKGLPPKEMDSAAAVIEFVQKTPGAIGYVDAAELRPGLNVLARQ
ncbi:hypothetical protein [Zoogloea sp.]|jgi:ABC-type phosphate transport system substrate-binding protein|uniref:hypothetical protein n=1 Tax=Zoogloea sp. TaxID=49181 RepID=UPI0037DA7801